MPTTRVNDIAMYYEVRGEGRPLLLIPGLGTEVTDYGPIVEALVSAGCRVIALDNRGAGRSDKPDAPYTIEMMADDAAALLDQLALGTVAVMGVSMGGRIALGLVLRRPDLVGALVLVSTSARVEHSRRFGVLDAVSRLPFPKGPHPQPRYAFERQRDAARAFDATPRLGEISVPTLIVSGTKDRIVPHELTRELQAGIAGSTLATYEGGHMSIMFRRHPEVAQAIARFLDESSRPPTASAARTTPPE